jgi:hypothetical protein
VVNLDSHEVVRVSVEEHEFDVDVDLEENVATATVTEEIAIEDLFVDGQLRLWADDDGWSGFLVEDGAYYHVNTRHGQDDWIARLRVGEQAVQDGVKKHIEDPKAGEAGRFVRGCSPP